MAIPKALPPQGWWNKYIEMVSKEKKRKAIRLSLIHSMFRMDMEVKKKEMKVDGFFVVRDDLFTPIPFP